MSGAQSQPALASRERYERYQREVRTGTKNSSAGPRPRQFDENGLPIAQRNASFLGRFGRLLGSR